MAGWMDGRRTVCLSHTRASAQHLHTALPIQRSTTRTHMRLGRLPTIISASRCQARLSTGGYPPPALALPRRVLHAPSRFQLVHYFTVSVSDGTNGDSIIRSLSDSALQLPHPPPPTQLHFAPKKFKRCQLIFQPLAHA